MKRRPCWCPMKLILLELSSFLMQMLSFVPINSCRYWPRKWKHSIYSIPTFVCFFLQYLHVSVKYLLGSRMSHKCVNLFHCGTHAPGWLRGAHPLITEGAVMRQVCFHWNDDCCYFKQQILVRNCEDFYVYELPGTEKSFLRYCGNSKKHHHLEL